MRRTSLNSILTVIALPVGLLMLILVVSHLSDHSDNAEPSSVKCQCPTMTESTVKINLSTVTNHDIVSASTSTTDIAFNNTSTTQPLSFCKEIDKSSPVQRAIIIYYPHHQSEYFFPEVRWYVQKNIS